MTITKKLELADRLKREMDSAYRDAHEAGRIDPRGCCGQGHFITGSQPGHREEREETEREGKGCTIASARTRSRLPTRRSMPLLSNIGPNMPG